MSQEQNTQRYVPDTVIVAEHNDLFRKAVCAGQRPQQQITGIMVITRSMTAQGQTFVLNALAAICSFGPFEPDNDPEGYHDFGAVEIEGEKAFFKIDLFEAGTNKAWGAETPDKPETVERIMTIMLASDW